MMDFDYLPLTPGHGFNLAINSFTGTDLVVRGLPFGGVAFGPWGGPYDVVTAATGLPVQQQTGGVWDYNLKQYAGVAVGPANAVHVQPGAGAVFTVTGVVGITGNVEIVNDVGNPIPVSGTFWQATQPVSGPLTDTQLRATAVPVSGTFWQATQPVSGTVTANVGTTNGLALDATLTGGSQIAKAKTLQVTGTGAALNDTPMAATDVGDYHSIAIHVTGVFVATYTFEHSNDGTNWLAALTYQGGSTAPSPSSGSSGTNTIFQASLFARYFRVRVSAYTSGTVSITAWLTPASPPTLPMAQIVGSGQVAGVQSGADGQGSGGLTAQANLYYFSGASSDRARGNCEVTPLTSAARTTLINSPDQINYNARGAVVVVDVTAGGGAGGITVTIKGKDTLSGKYSTILASAVIAVTGTTKLIVYPGVAAAANSKADEPLPRLWRVEVTVADATSFTYSIGANYIL